MVMATDGLWDKLTSDEVVQLVGDLLDGKTGQDEIVLDRGDTLAYRKRLQSVREQEVVASGAKVEENQEHEGGEVELTPEHLAPRGPARKFTFRDHAHAATHLIRNALGGSDDDKVAATLSIPSPMSRRYRDDISGMGIFCFIALNCVVFPSPDTNLSLNSHGGILWTSGQQDDTF